MITCGALRRLGRTAGVRIIGVSARPWICLCVTLAGLAGAPLHAASGPARDQRPALAELPRYMVVLTLYRQGRGDEAVARLLEGGEKLLDEGLAARRGANSDLLAMARAGAMLHSDTTAVAWDLDQRFARRHLALGMDWARTAGALGDVDFERRWTLGAGLLLVELGSRVGGVGAALDHFAAACAHFENDLPLLVAAAWLEERAAMAPVVFDAEFVDQRRGEGPARDKQRFLERARARLERARTVAPGDDEVTLRLAHIALRLDDPRAARRLLEPLLARSTPRPAAHTYLAQVFLAQSLRALDDDTAAARALDAAIALMPGPQTARLERAAIPASRDVPAPGTGLVDSLRDDGGDQPDPWVDYLVGRLSTGPPLRAALRREAQA
jgi:Tetratricopeptide repeat